MVLALCAALFSAFALAVTPGSVTYQYDEAGRLKSATYSNSSGETYTLDAAGNRKTTVQVGPDVSAPGAPGTPAFSAITAATATATWTAATDNVGVTGYDYSLNSGSWTNLGNVLSANLSGLTPSTLYSFALRARDGAGNTGATSSASFTTTADTTAPSAPGVPTFSNIAQTTATVSWTAATDNVGVTSYEYQKNGGAWTSVGNVLTTNLTGLTASTNYTIGVHAKDAAGNTGTASTASFVTSGVTTNAGTLSQGTYNTGGGNVLITIKGFGASPAIGSYTPVTLTGGKTVSAFQDFARCTGSGTSQPPSCPTTPPNITNQTQASVSISGFTADPGVGWLVSATAGGVTRSGSAAAYSYSGGVGMWIWSGTSNLFGFTGSGTTSTTIVHQ